MHQVIVESLEEYISGAISRTDQRDIEAHLQTCEGCRRELNGMLETSSLLGSLRPSGEITAPPGFYARVQAQVSTMQAPSFWSLFSLDAAFGRRVIFASLLTMALLGSFLISRETGYAPAPVSPEAAMAEHDSTSRDTMLVTLTSYEP